MYEFLPSIEFDLRYQSMSQQTRIRAHLQQLIDRIDSNTLSADECELLAMTLLVTKFQISTKHAENNGFDSLRFLALGWFVSGMCAENEV